MKDYIKPTFALAGLSPVALAVSGDCNAKLSDDVISSAFEQMGIEDINQAFAISEQCDIGIPDEFLSYCKYTSVESGSLKVLGS